MKRCLTILLTVLLLCGCAAGPQEYPIEEENIRRLTQTLCDEIGPREVGSPGERAACDELEKELEALGFSGEDGTLLRESFTCLDGRESENLTAVCNGGGEGPILVVVAHYDSVPSSPGAGDNAVSAGILMEIARVLGTASADFDGEIRMVFLGGEETGYHGSRCWLEQLPPQDRQRVRGCFNMDISAAVADSGAVLVCNTLGMTTAEGYVEGNFMEPADNLVSRSVAKAWEELYGDGFGGLYSVGESDHVSFHDQQIDAANVCWRLPGNPFPVLPETYHKPTDLPETLDYTTAVKTGQCVLWGLRYAFSEISRVS